MNINFIVNNFQYETKKDIILIEALARNNIEIPRFCFNENLSIAGNCRMCIIEVKNTLKPVVSCAVNVTENMVIFTNTKLVKQGRENVLEFLLINHPLDCPVCDQGGECDLQDQAYVFGTDRGRFYEFKRAVNDDILAGPIIKTILTRCIHCTRCVRFFEEIGGIPFFGMINRGSNMQISNIKNIDFELSGNVIDLCPVGALTFKPTAFMGRPWEYDYGYSIDCFDTFCSFIRIDYKNNQEIIRILPRINNSNSVPWISDKIRLIFDVLNYKGRYSSPYVLVKNLYIKITWKKAINSIVNSMLNFHNQSRLLILGDYLDMITITRLKFFYFLSNLKTISIYNKYLKKDLKFTNNIAKNQSLFFSKINFFINFKKLKNLMLINCNLRYEFPILNSIIRKYSLITDCLIFVFGNIKNCSFNFKFLHIGVTNFDVFKFIAGKLWACNFFIDFYNLYYAKKVVSVFIVGFSNIFQNLFKDVYFIIKYLNNLNQINIFNFNIINFLQSNITLINLFFLNSLLTINYLSNNKYLFYYSINEDVFDFNKKNYCFLTNSFKLLNKYKLNWVNDEFSFYYKKLIKDFSIFINKNDISGTFRIFYLLKNLITFKTYNFNKGIKIYQGFNIELLIDSLYKEKFNFLLPSKNWFEYDSKTYRFDGYLINFFKVFNKQHFRSNIEILEKVIDHYQINKLLKWKEGQSFRFHDFVFTMTNLIGPLMRLNNYDGKLFYFINKIIRSYKNFYFFLYKFKYNNNNLIKLNIFLFVNFINKYYTNDLFSKMSCLLNISANFFKKEKNI